MNSMHKDQTTSVLPEMRTEPISGLSAYNSGPTPFGHMTQLFATVSGGTHVRYEWDCGDGHRARGANILHTYEHPGEYMATVIARNAVNRMKATTFVIVGQYDVWTAQPAKPQSGLELR